MKKYNFGMWCQQAKKFLLGNAEAKRERELHKQAYREVQVKEYDGALWLCHRGIPLVREGSAKKACPNWQSRQENVGLNTKKNTRNEGLYLTAISLR